MVVRETGHNPVFLKEGRRMRNAPPKPVARWCLFFLTLKGAGLDSSPEAAIDCAGLDFYSLSKRGKWRLGVGEKTFRELRCVDEAVKSLIPFACLGLSAAPWGRSSSEHTQNAVSRKDNGFAALLLAQDLNLRHLLFAKQLNYFGSVRISCTTPRTWTQDWSFKAALNSSTEILNFVWHVLTVNLWRFGVGR